MQLNIFKVLLAYVSFFFFALLAFNKIIPLTKIISIMKIKTQIAAVVLLIGIGAVIFNACSKSESTLPIKQNQEFSEYIPESDEVETLIKTFNASFADYKAGMKSMEDMPLNEALWYIEAGVNYEYRGEKEDLEDFNFDEFIVIVDMIEGNDGELLVEGNDLMDAYEELLGYAAEIMNTKDDVVLQVADVSIKTTNEQVTQFEMIIITASTSKGGINPINSTDYWYAFFDAGKCDSYSGYVGYDAAWRISSIVYNSFPQQACSSGTLYFTSIDNYDTWDTELFFFHESNTGNNYCMNPTEVEDDYDLAKGHADAKAIIAAEESKKFITCLFDGDQIGTGPTTYFHRYYYLKFGIPNCSGSGSK
jgi:hypothetical protein